MPSMMLAWQVLSDLVGRLSCRLLFATHYHPLTTEFEGNTSVLLKHMAFTFDRTSHHDGDVITLTHGDGRLVFLYALKSGACQASYGLQVSLLAGIPKPVVEAAEKAGEIMHQRLSAIFESARIRESFPARLKQFSDICSSVAFKTSEETAVSTNLCRTSKQTKSVDRYRLLLGLWQKLKSLN